MTAADDAKEAARRDAEDKKAKMMAAALPADADTEEVLRELHEVVLARRADPAADAEYEALRNGVVARLTEGGPRFFINEEGVKQYAYVVAPEGVEVDAAAIIELHEQGEIDDELFERLVPRQVDRDQLRTAIARGANPRSRKPGIAPEHVAKIARIVKRTAYVGFADAQEEERE